MKLLGKSLKLATLAAAMVFAVSNGSTSALNYRIHYLTEAGNSEPGFPYPYVGYSDVFCDSDVETYGKVTSNVEYEYFSTC